MLEKDLTHQIMKFRDHCQKGVNKKVIGLMKDELRGKIITEFVALRPKTDSYLTDGDTVHKKAKGTKKCVKKEYSSLMIIRNVYLKKKPILQLQQKFKSEAHNVYTEEINKIALSSDDDKRLQLFGNIASYMEQMLLKYAKVRC